MRFGLTTTRVTAARRYGMIFVGPVATAGAQFLASLCFMRLFPTRVFGDFTFLVILSQFVMGLWSALFCAALPVLMADREGASRERRVAVMMSANLWSTVPAALLFALIAVSTSLGKAASLLFAIFLFFSLLRWFGRAYHYALGRPAPVMISDVVYSVSVLVGLPVLLFRGDASGDDASALFAFASLVSFLAFGSDYLQRQFRLGSKSHLVEYSAIWKLHSGWSLLGVLTTELTTNAHVYIVTLIAGPTAFAGLAASVLLTRPVSVVMAALGEYERAHMAAQIGSGDMVGLGQSITLFRFAIVAIWSGTGAAIWAVLALRPGLIFPAHYPVPMLALGSAMWMAVVLVRGLRAPESAMMQGAGEFKLLARGSMFSAGMSVVGVIVALTLFGPIWSILGVLAGEILFGALLWPAAFSWRRRRAVQHEPKVRLAGGVGPA